jgi:ribonuclease D
MESLLRCAGTILTSSTLAVDIEGRLRKNGYIEMIQINTGLNTFLIDIHRILNNADMETFELCKKILRNAFCNPKIKKIFHDCRHDCLVLHEIMNTCVINIFDTSPVETLIGQLDVYQNCHNKK